MSSGFKVAGEVFWGTNGAVEAYIEALATQASERFGAANPIAQFFRREQNAFPLTGAVIFLDEVLPDASAYQQFIQLLDGATQALLEANTFSEYGREWVETVVGSLRTRLSYLSNALV